MASNLDLSATLQLIDEITGPLRSIQSQVSRATDSFNEARKAVRDLERQQSDISSFQKMQSQIAKTSENLQRAKDRVAALSEEFKNTANPSATLTNRLASARRNTDRLTQAMDNQHRSLAGVQARLRSAGVNTDNLSDEQRRLADSIADANRQLDQQRQRMDRVRNAQQMSQRMGDMRNKSAGLAAGGAAATYAAAQLIKPGLEFEEAMSRLQALTKLDKTSPQLQELKQQAQMLGASTQFTQADAARGQAFLAMAGFTPESIRSAMPGMLDLALAGGMDLPQTADIASNILSGMNLDPSQMSNVADVLSGAFTRANLDVAMLGETMKYAAPGAAGLGVSLEEVAAMAGKLGDAGIQASESGTAIRSIMQRLAGLPEPVKKALNKIGVETKDAHGNLKPVTEILEEIYEKTENLGTADRSALLTQIAGMNASGAMEKLVQYAGSGELQELTETLKNVDGEASNLAKTMSDNTIGDFKAAMSATDALRTSLFEANKDGIRAFMQGVTKLVQKMTTWAQAHPELIALLGKVFGILAVGAVVIGSIGAALLTVLGPMALLRASLVTLGLPSTLQPITFIATAFNKLKTLVMGLRFTGLINSISSVITVIRSLSMALLTTPIGWAIMAIALAALLIIKYWEPVKAFFAGMWDGFMQGISPLLASLSNLKVMLGQIFAPLKPVLDMVIWALQSLAEAFMWLITPAQSTQAQLNSATESGRSFGFVLGTIVGLIGQVVAGLVGALALGLQTIGTAIGTFAAMIVVHGGRAVSYVAGLPARFMAFLASLPARMAAMGGQIMDGLKNGIMNKANAVVDGIKGVAGRIKGAFTGLMGIRSPSRVFAGYGDFMMQGLNQGLLSNNAPIDAMLKTSNQLRSVMDTSAITFDKRRPIIAANDARFGSSQGNQTPAPITINIYTQPHQNEQQIAQLVAQQIQKAQLGQNNQNTALYDHAEGF